jgi:outer membrane protein OmpA-like peptidoglycan-associated protein
MRKFVSPLTVALVVLTLGLTGCATEKYVQEQVAASEGRTNTKIGEVQTSVEGAQAEISKLQAKDAEIEKQLAKLSDAAKEAMQRADEAGKLAKGKFVYEVTLKDNDAKFALNKHDLSDEAKAVLDAFAEKIKSANKNVYIEIQGHTCKYGSEKHNLTLGYKRAKQVMDYLSMTHGFALHRMNVISYGEMKPIGDNDTKEGREQNRRVTIIVLE